MAKHPEASETFNRAMVGAQQLAGNPFSEFDFSNYKTVVDLGGGKGTLLSEILKQHPFLQGILFDLSEAVTEAPELFSSTGLKKRCEIKTGSIFNSVPSGGDIYILSRILHDWSDEKALLILLNCRKVMPQKGSLLIRDAILPTKEIPPMRLHLDLMMMVMTGGKERTEEEWKMLLNKSGFNLSRIWKTNTNHDLLEAKPS